MKGTELTISSGIPLFNVKNISKVEIGEISYDTIILLGITGPILGLIPLLNGTTALAKQSWYSTTQRPATRSWYDITTLSGAPTTWTKEDILNMDVTVSAEGGSTDKAFFSVDFYVDVINVRVTWTKKPAGLLFAHNF